MFDRFGDKRAVEWAKSIKERDDYTCQICFKQGVPLHSHHLNSFDKFINQRYELQNGVTLCKKCHNLLHLIYGKGNNGRYQYEELKQSIAILRKIIIKLGEIPKNYLSRHE